jgi:DNA-directed RNA polymerase subunit RPC12/RpoP
MKWTNLGNNKCPQCGKDLLSSFDKEKEMFICKCGFKIKEQRFKELVSKNSQSNFKEEEHYRPEDENPE